MLITKGYIKYLLTLIFTLVAFGVIHSKAQYQIDSLKSQLKIDKISDYEKSQICKELSKLYFHQDFDSLYHYNKLEYEFLKDSKNYFEQYENILYKYFVSYINIGVFNLEDLEKELIKIPINNFNQDQSKYLQAYYNLDMGLYYYGYMNYTKALKYISLAITDDFSSSKFIDLNVWAYCFKCNLLSNMMNDNSAHRTLDTIYQKKDLLSEQNLAAIHIARAKIYGVRLKFDSAMKYINLSYDMVKKSEANFFKSYVFHEYAFYYHDQNKSTDSIILYSLKSLESVKKLK